MSNNKEIINTFCWTAHLFTTHMFTNLLSLYRQKDWDTVVGIWQKQLGGGIYIDVTRVR